MNENSTRPITDEDRRLGESKKLTINPAHVRVVTDDIPDEQIATNHLVRPPVANTSNDTEQNSRPIQQSIGSLKEHASQPPQRQNRSSLLVLGIFITGGIITIAIFFFAQ